MALQCGSLSPLRLESVEPGLRRAEISAIKDMSCQKNPKLIKVEGSVFFFSSENGIKTCLERRAPPVPSAPKAAPASVLLCPCILITTLLIFMRLGTQGGLQSVILSLFLSLSPHLSRLNLCCCGFFPSPSQQLLCCRPARRRVCTQPRRHRACKGPRGGCLCLLVAQFGVRLGGWVQNYLHHTWQPRHPEIELRDGRRCAGVERACVFACVSAARSGSDAGT